MSSGDVGLPPATGVASRNVMGNTAVVDWGVDWIQGNCKHGQCGLCARGCHQCSSCGRCAGAYLW